MNITLKAARVNAGFTAEVIANMMGKTKQTILNWEKGQGSPRTPDAKKLAEIYKMPFDNINFPYSKN